MYPNSQHVSTPHHSNIRHFFGSINFSHVLMTIAIPLLGFMLALYVPLQRATFIWSCVYWFLTGMGITAGYHRLWAHKTYEACWPLRVMLALLGAGAVQGSIRRWSRDHRAHHRYVDTEKDPYNVHTGLLYAHMGWIIFKQDPKSIGKVDIRDLDADPVVIWQHHHYGRLLLFCAFILPTAVAGLCWKDWWGGFVYAGCLRMFISQQSTYCVNSLAHWLGDQPYQSMQSPRDNFIVAILTLGEGYHNFHHEFPNDYRNGVGKFDFDPTKWFVNALAGLNLAYDLKTFPDNEIRKVRLQERSKVLDVELKTIDWGTPNEQLPILTIQEVEHASKNGAKWTCIDGLVYDISNFINQHPGGNVILSGVGKDASGMFNGGIYHHSNAARNFLSQMKRGKLETRNT